MSLPLLIALYSGIAFAIYFLVVYFDLMSSHDDITAMICCGVWPFTGLLIAITLGVVVAAAAAALVVAAIVAVIASPFLLLWYCFKGVEILAERARG